MVWCFMGGDYYSVLCTAEVSLEYCTTLWSLYIQNWRDCKESKQKAENMTSAEGLRKVEHQRSLLTNLLVCTRQ